MALPVAILAGAGYSWAWVLDALFVDNAITTHPPRPGALWWFPCACGLAGVFLGTLAALLDRWWWWWVRPAGAAVAAPGPGRPLRLLGRQLPWLRLWREPALPPCRGWSNVMRCFVGYAGVCYACCHVPWDSSRQFARSLSFLCAGFWWTVDRTARALLMGGGLGSGACPGARPGFRPARQLTHARHVALPLCLTFVRHDIYVLYYRQGSSWQPLAWASSCSSSAAADTGGWRPCWRLAAPPLLMT